MPAPPAFQFYTGDWIKSPELTKCSAATRGIWIDLLCRIHDLDKDGRISGTVVSLARQARAFPDEMERALAELEEAEVCGIERVEGSDLIVITSRRMQRDQRQRGGNRERQQRYRDSRSSNGDSNAERNGENNGPLTPLSEDEVEEEEEVEEENEGRGKTVVRASDCEAVYALYPRKRGKGAAMKAIRAAIKRVAQGKDPPPDPTRWLKDRVAEYAESVRGKNKQYVPYPATWMNEERYLDEQDDEPARTNGRDVARDYEQTRRITRAALGLEPEPVGDALDSRGRG
jgi:hypothetical protein